MKKLFFVMAAVAALLTSCSKDDTFGGPTRGKVTFEVSTPELATRYGEGTTATALQYAVYDMIEDATNGKLVDTGKATLSNKTASVSIDLVEGRKYTAIFWADAGENASPYTFTPATKTVSYTDVNDLTANNEAYDAFYAFVPQADIKVGQTVDVDLKRPFAQLRIETSDTDRAKQLGVEVVKTGITVNAYTSFNLATGAVDGQQNITFKPTDKASAPRATVSGADYDLISMNYILANHTNADLVDVTLNFTDDVNGTEESYVRKYSNIDVQRNYRTIVRGTILTDPTQFDVEVKPGFDSDISEDRNTSETLVVSTADEIIDAFENLNDNNSNNDPTTIVMGDDINLNDLGSLITYDNSAALSTTTRAGEKSYGLLIPAGKTLTLDLNGFTISQVKAQTGNYSMIQNDGNLTIMDSSTTGAGKLSYKDSGNGGEYISNTITNRGTLTVKSGRIENVSSETTANVGYCYAIDTGIWGEAEEVVVNIEGGEVASIYSPLRVRADSQTEQVTANISGGKIYGRIDHQMSSSTAGVKGALNISGGEFYKQGITDANLMIFGAGVDTDASGITASITGGTFDAPIVIHRGENVPLGKNFNEHFISGGTFHDASVFKYLSDSAEEINITMAADMTLDGGTSLNYGGENLKKLTINGDNHKLTYKDSYRTSINLANANATLVLNNMQLFRETSNTNTHWHNNNMKFENNTEMNNVTFNKGITLDDAKTFKLNDVTITKNAVSTYAMFITAGCDVTIDGMTINHAEGVNGRGIKIVDEDVTNKDAQTKLNISNAKFTTAEKAAVLVLSKGGAVINWGEGNDISKVAEDKVWAVWIDEDAAKKYNYDNSLVIVNGALVRVEGEIPTEITTDSAEVMAGAIAAGVPNINLTGDVTYGTAINNDATIDLGGNTFEATGTIKLNNNADLTMTGGDYEVNSTYGHIDVRPSSAEGSELLFEGVNFSFNKLGPTYGPSTNRLGSVVEVCATTADALTKIKFKDCTFDNASVLFEGLSGTTGTIDAVFENCTFDALTSSAPVEVDNYVKGTITMTGCTFNLECTSSTASAVSISPSSSTEVTLVADGNTLNATAATPYTYDASLGETEADNVKVNGTPKNIKFISAYENATVTETNTTKTGIAAQ